jgi:hypothetical protein
MQHSGGSVFAENDAAKDKWLEWMLRRLHAPRFRSENGSEHESDEDGWAAYRR